MIVFHNTKLNWANYHVKELHLEKKHEKVFLSALDERILQYQSDLDQYSAKQNTHIGAFRNSCKTLLGYLHKYQEFKITETEEMYVVQYLANLFGRMEDALSHFLHGTE